MAKVWFCYEPPTGYPEEVDILEIARLRAADRVATSLNLTLERSGGDEKYHEYVIYCEDSDVAELLEKLLESRVVPGSIDFDDPSSDHDEIATITLAYTTPEIRDDTPNAEPKESTVVNPPISG